jgi:putative RNA 2'-phosphotransferase
LPRKSQIRVDSLGRIMVYILGHRPDEFGLVPGEEGFVPVKEFLLAIHEEPGWGYVRQGHINEVLAGKDRSLFHVEGSAIRALDRRWRLDLVNPAPTLPSLLFAPIRRRAHPHALDKGLRAGEGTRLVLFPDASMALRVGKRRDQKPVVLEVNADRARREGVCFYAFGEVFLAGEIPAGCITGPPLPKETVKARETEKEKRPGDLPLPHFEAGTFTLDLGRDPAPHRRGKGKKGKGWKEEARNLRRRKGR